MTDISAIGGPAAGGPCKGCSTVTTWPARRASFIVLLSRRQAPMSPCWESHCSAAGWLSGVLLLG